MLRVVPYSRYIIEIDRAVHSLNVATLYGENHEVTFQSPSVENACHSERMLHFKILPFGRMIFKCSQKALNLSEGIIPETKNSVVVTVLIFVYFPKTWLRL